MIKNAYRSLCKVPFSFVRLIKLEFSRQILEKILKYQILYKSVQGEPSGSTRTGGRTDTHDEASSRFCNFVNTSKMLKS